MFERNPKRAENGPESRNQKSYLMVSFDQPSNSAMADSIIQ